MALRSYDPNVLATVPSYDLASKADRARSTSALENLFFRLVRDLAIDLFIEAGAKDAGSSRRVSALCENARIVAFEANPRTYRRFRKVNAPPELRVEYLHLALSDEPGVVRFFIRRREDGRLHADGQGSLFKRPDHPHGYKKVRVEATSLDHFFANHRYERCAMWIDVEGASRQVLRGATQILHKTSVAFIEVQDAPIWSAQDPLVAEIVGFFHEAGLLPVARDHQARHLFNVVFVREQFLDVPQFRVSMDEYQSAVPSAVVRKPRLGLLRRKARKLARRPNQFFADSKLAIVRRLGRLIWR